MKEIRLHCYLFRKVQVLIQINQRLLKLKIISKKILILKLEQNKKLIQLEKSKLNYNEEDSYSDDKPKHSKWKKYKVIAGHKG